jgi:DNA gyrase/topoisomerase IV subunit A
VTDSAHEVLDVLLAAGNREAAGAALMTRFGFDEVQATVVLDMQFAQVTGEKRAEIQSRLLELGTGIAPPEEDE